MPVTFAIVRRIARALPDVHEQLCHGTPAFYVGKKLFVRLREDGENIAVAFPRSQRDELIEQTPDVFSVTPHFENYDYVLLHLLSVNETTLSRMIESAWRLRAGKKRIAASDAGRRTQP